MILALTIFLSAFLLFQVQLIVAKHLLPWFGGAPAVWTTCQLFFQVALLGGYAYAHRLSRIGSLRAQGAIHLALLGAAVATLLGMAWWSGLPLLAPERLRPTGDGHPAAWLLLLLAITVGLPFFLLSATGPLLQRWHSHTTDSLHRTYRLYALSNAGSLLGLLTYPFAVESLWDVATQAQLWTGLFLLFSAACGAVAWQMRRRGKAGRALETSTDEATAGAGAPSGLAEGRRTGFWFLLAFSSSAMFLATTNQLSLEVAAVPFLWVLPLGIYLLTFIICFDRPQWYSPRWLWLGAAAATLGILPVSLLGSVVAIPHQIAGYGVFLTLFCLVCHGELARLRPGSARLTQFYLWIAIGGAAGGCFIGLGAPALFPDVWEFSVMVVAGWSILGALGLADHSSHLRRGDRWHFWLAACLMAILAAHYAIVSSDLQNSPMIARFDWRAPVLVGLAAGTVSSLALAKRRLPAAAVWPGFLVLALLLVATGVLLQRMKRSADGSVFAARDFYGVLRIHDAKASPLAPLVRQLRDGNTIHGVQVLEHDQEKVATAYYSPSSGIAVAMRHLRRALPGREPHRSEPLHLGVLGMGAGTMAAFTQAGDRLRFYEINPTVRDIAFGPQSYFSFVKNGAADVTVAIGDGRLELERELLEQASVRFDLLAMDAFSSDSVPVHLLTREAFKVYASHLRGKKSILAVNITNRHLDLEPVVTASARREGFSGIRVDSDGDRPIRMKSSWVLLSRDDQTLQALLSGATRARWLLDREVLFTDRYSNLFRVLK